MNPRLLLHQGLVYWKDEGRDLFTSLNPCNNRVANFALSLGSICRSIPNQKARNMTFYRVDKLPWPYRARHPQPMARRESIQFKFLLGIMTHVYSRCFQKGLFNVHAVVPSRQKSDSAAIAKHDRSGKKKTLRSISLLKTESIKKPILLLQHELVITHRRAHLLVESDRLVSKPTASIAELFKNLFRKALPCPFRTTPALLLEVFLFLSLGSGHPGALHWSLDTFRCLTLKSQSLRPHERC